MKSIRLLLALVVLLAACAPRRPLPVTPPEPASHSTASPAPTAVAVATAPATPDGSALRLRPAVSTPPTIDAETTARHLRIFEQLWNTVNSQYVYPDFRGVDWAAAYDEFKARLDGGLSDEEFWQAMSELIDRLGDDHSTFLTPDQARQEDDQLQGDLTYVGIGIYATSQMDKRQAVIFGVFPGSPAEAAGLRAHDAILAIDGQPVVDADGADQLDRLRGPSGTPVDLRVRSPGEAPREVRVIRRRIDGTLRATGRLLRFQVTGQRIGYVMIPTLWDAAIEASARQTLIDLMAGGPLDGLIIDMRINGGGVSTNLLALLGFFTEGQHGEFASRGQTRPLAVAADPIGNSLEVPLIILAGPDTQSFAELFSGVLHEAGRARLVGTTTAGNIETIYGYDFEDGSRAWIARETFVPLSGADWEESGLVPDVTVNADWDEFTEDDDPHIAAALELLAQPAGGTAPP